ncbi:hypothetical protein HAHI6034_12915 [Hathewaya histolytica]|uniref:Uncharacterized protein n=1 Tax=Hathewaya histolytica TaxID=1498 RepID=A0A4U9QZE7_HATHI|nr:hypothetical protein [Hathewaya histolytica]VTQ81750.1 Uncharacterised protein [Hathewaya histolytica]
MIDKQLKMVIAENCNEYVDKISIIDKSFNNNTCSRCINYKHGQCTKKIFNVMKEIISLN